MFGKIFQSLHRTRERFFNAISSVIPLGKKLTRDDVDALEEILIGADIGVLTTEEIIAELADGVASGEMTGSDAVEILKNHLLAILGEPSHIKINHKPHLFLIVGVNGTGKTTTIAKLAYRLKSGGAKVLLAAADTFRAAAAEQLTIWAQKVGTDIVCAKMGADPSAVIFDAAKKAKAKGYDVVIADTAGRLHTKKNLMEELKKMARVAGKVIDGAPHDTLLVLDATTGQNGLSQAEVFNRAVPLSGVILTKLDGTAKGGIAVAIRRRLGIPIKAVGIGEKLTDMEDFSPSEYVDALLMKEDRLNELA